MDLTNQKAPELCKENCEKRGPGCQDKCGYYIGRAAIALYYKQLAREKQVSGRDAEELNRNVYRKRKVR